MRDILLEGELGCSTNFAALGRAHTGYPIKYDDNITRIGKNYLLVLPDYDVIGVFDSARNYPNIGSAGVAGLVACHAIRSYFKNDGACINDAMSFARETVSANPEAGLCSGALVQIAKSRRSICFVNAGNTGLLTYDPTTNQLYYIAEQQIAEHGWSANYIGRQPAEPPYNTPDFSGMHELNGDDEKIYIATAGALGNWRFNTDLKADNFGIAHYGIPLLRAAQARYPNIEETIKDLLKKEKAGDLLESQLIEVLDEYEPNINSPALLNPNDFDINNIDWTIWEEIILPYLESLGIKVNNPTKRALLEELLNRTVRWSFETPKPEDALIVMLDNNNI